MNVIAVDFVPDNDAITIVAFLHPSKEIHARPLRAFKLHVPSFSVSNLIGTIFTFEYQYPIK